MSIQTARPHQLRELLRSPLGRLLWTRDTGDSLQPADMFFQSHLSAVLTRRDGSTKSFDLGSGLVTNVGVLAMANDPSWAAPSGASAATLALQKWHATGTGVTAAAATDIALQTLAAPTTANAVAGVNTLVSAANLQKFQSVATINYTSSLAITEWGLHSAQVLSATTGTPLTATTASSATAQAASYVASSATVQGEQQLVIRTGTTTVWGLILSNGTALLTIPTNGWYKVADGTAGATPGATEAFTLIPVMWDHKVFAAINVNNGDSIAFTYLLTVNSGG
jgi:hypothetical protein